MRNSRISGTWTALSGFGTILSAILLTICCKPTVGGVIAVLGSLIATAVLCINCFGVSDFGSGLVKIQCVKSLLSGVSNSVVTIAMGFMNLVTPPFGIALMVIGFISLLIDVAMYIIAVRMDAANKNNYDARQQKLKATVRADEVANQQHSNQMLMEKAAYDMANQKIKNAKAVEKSKTRAVKTASTAATVGSVSKPKQAIEYANASGALKEGKSIADKLSERVLGDVSSPVDVDYKEVANTMQGTMSDADSVFVESVKTLSKEALFQLLVKGAQNLGIDANGREIQEIAQDVITYSPPAIKENMPEDLDDTRKAAFLIEKMGVEPDAK